MADSTSVAMITVPKQTTMSNGTLLPSFDGCSWLCLDTYKIDSQTAISKGDTGISATKQQWTFRFLMPENFSESIQHTWSDYSSFTSDFASRFVPLAQKVSGAVQGVSNLLSSSSLTSSNTTASQTTDILGTSEGTSVMRFDTALVYQTSQRRRYMFELHFADLGDPYYDVVYPIKMLEYLSSAEVESGFAQITRPYVFQVYTAPSRFLYLRYAALESILPTYQGPYRNGYPSYANVQLTFVELDPLYNTQFDTELNGTSDTTSSSTTSSTVETYVYSNGSTSTITQTNN